MRRESFLSSSFVVWFTSELCEDCQLGYKYYVILYNLYGPQLQLFKSGNLLKVSKIGNKITLDYALKIKICCAYNF